MKKRALILLVIGMFFCLLAPSVTATTKNTLYPDHTEVGQDVRLTKDAKWMYDKNKAEVKLTFNGLEDVIVNEKNVDVLFVLDNSGSMRWQSGCVHADHESYKTFYINPDTSARYPGAIINDENHLSWNDDLKPLVKEKIDSGEINTATKRLEKDVLIKIPDNLTQGDFDLYLFPANEDFSQLSASSYINYGFLSNESWNVVDLNQPIANYKDEGRYKENRYTWYHVDECAVRQAVSNNYVNKGSASTWVLFSSGINYATGNPVYQDLGTYYKNIRCISSDIAMRNAVSEFSKDLLATSPESRVSVAAFNTNARGDTSSKSNLHLPFTNHLANIDTYLYGTFGVESVGNNFQWTNYEAGMLSGQDILDTDLETVSMIDGDTRSDNGHQKVMIFLTDGIPNTQSKDKNMTTPAGTADGGGKSSKDQAFNAAKIIVDEMKADYPNLSIYTATFQQFETEGSVDDYTKPFMTEDAKHFVIDDYTDEDNQFLGAFNDIYETIVSKTKIVTVEDTIDSNFKVDKKTLLENKDNYYFPSYATVKVEEVTCDDGAIREKVIFTYKADATQQELEAVKIPLLLRPEATSNTTEGYVPTNYDGLMSKGASTEYVDLDGKKQVLETSKTWLPTGIAKILKVDEDSQTKVLAGAQFKLYYASDDSLYSDQTYITDSRGEIVIDTLPPVEYYFKEIQAPSGYEADLNMKYQFTISVPQTVTEIVSLLVTNKVEEDIQTTGELQISKTVVGDLGETTKDFTFTVHLTDTTGNPLTDNYTYSGSKTGSIHHGGEVVLKHNESITITGIPLGSQYSISELEANTDGYVTSTTDDIGTITLAGSSAVFINARNSVVDEATVVLLANKLLDNKIPQESKYSFVLTDEVGNILQTKSNINSIITFDALTFDTIGTYVYKITEIKGTDESIVYDESVYTVIVNVSELDGKLNTTTSYKKDGQTYDGLPIFKNNTKPSTISPTIDVILKATKTLDSKEPTSNQFEFYLKNEEGQIIQTKKNNKGQIVFDAIEFDKEGTYRYTLNEVKGADKNIEYDETVYTVIVTIESDGTGLSASVSYEKEGKAYTDIPVFKNITLKTPVDPAIPTPPTNEDDGDVLGEDIEQDDTIVVVKDSQNIRTSDNTQTLNYVIFMGVSGILLTLHLFKKRQARRGTR